MSVGIKVTREHHTAAELRVVASRCKDAEQVRRLLSLALVLEEFSRGDAAARNGMDRQTLRDWVHRHNDLGIEGLKSRRSPGGTPLLTKGQTAELLALVVKGPDPERDKVVRWRCVDLRDEVERRFAVRVHENTIGTWLRELKFTRLQPRPFHPRKDPAAQEASKKPVAGRCPPVAVETGSAMVILEVERPPNFWWWQPRQKTWPMGCCALESGDVLAAIPVRKLISRHGPAPPLEPRGGYHDQAEAVSPRAGHHAHTP